MYICTRVSKAHRQDMVNIHYFGFGRVLDLVSITSNVNGLNSL